MKKIIDFLGVLFAVGFILESDDFVFKIIMTDVCLALFFGLMYTPLFDGDDSL